MQYTHTDELTQHI